MFMVVCVYHNLSYYLVFLVFRTGLQCKMHFYLGWGQKVSKAIALEKLYTCSLGDCPQILKTATFYLKGQMPALADKAPVFRRPVPDYLLLRVELLSGEQVVARK